MEKRSFFETPLINVILGMHFRPQSDFVVSAAAAAAGGVWLMMMMMMMMIEILYLVSSFWVCAAAVEQ